jgi:integral membrane protein
MNTSLLTFRRLALAEGISFIVLLAIAMPLKYMLDIKGVVPAVGAVHGLLFMIYLVVSLNLSHRLQWSISRWLLVMLAAIVPAGTFLLDIWLKKLPADQS